MIEIINKKEIPSPNFNFNLFGKRILKFEEQDEETRKTLIEQDHDYGKIALR